MYLLGGSGALHFRSACAVGFVTVMLPCPRSRQCDINARCLCPQERWTQGSGEKGTFSRSALKICVLLYSNSSPSPPNVPKCCTHRNHASVLEDSGLTTVNWFIFPAGQLFNFLLEVCKYWHCLLLGKGPNPRTVSLASSGT